MKRSILLFSIIVLLSNCAENTILYSSQEQINKDLTQKLEKLDHKIDIEKILAKCSSEKEREAMKFLYAYMPIGDISDYDYNHYLTGIKYAFLAQAEMPWGLTIPEDVFRHFVLPLRINNEDMDNARPVFYEELRDRVKGLSMYDAALEVNHWCHEKAIYTPSDIRTSSPMSTVKTAHGRCGEESVFTAAALRAVGIPARQVYTPRWGHSDDNHAWVEVWIDGTWHYLGACEPEPKLNVAWFSSTALRGLLMHTRVFGKYNGPEDIITTTDCYTEINVTENYAPVEKIDIKIIDRNNKVIEGVKVEFKIYNYSEFYSAITALTDKKGRTSATFGKGDILVWASKGNLFGYQKVSVGKDGQDITIFLDKDIGEVFSDELDMTPPIDSKANIIITAEETAANAIRLAYEDSIRGAYTATFAKYKDAQSLRKEVHINTKKIEKYLVESRGNWKDISNYLLAIKKSPSLGSKLLDLISKKDLRDTPTEILLDHIVNFHSNSTELNLKYILNPRIGNELLSPWRGKFQDLAKEGAFGEKKLTPESIINFTKEIKVFDNYNPLEIPMSPIGVYNLMAADKLSRDVFFVALCRSAGIPARIEEVNSKVQYYQKQKWHDANLDTDTKAISAPKGKLRVTYKGQQFINDPKFETHFTIAKIEDGSIQTLNFRNREGYEGTMSWRNIARNPISLDVGYYMLTSGTRMASGKVLSNISFFEILEDETSRVELIMREDQTELQVIGGMNAEMKFSKILPNKKRVKSSILETTGRGFFVLCFMEANHEPSNHAIRSLFSKSPKRPTIIFYQTEEEYQKHLRGTFPNPPEGIHFGIDTEQNIFNTISKEMKLRNVEYPLFIIADTFGRIVYMTEGYNIGIADQLEKLGE